MALRPLPSVILVVTFLFGYANGEFLLDPTPPWIVSYHGQLLGLATDPFPWRSWNVYRTKLYQWVGWRYTYIHFFKAPGRGSYFIPLYWHFWLLPLLVVILAIGLYYGKATDISCICSYYFEWRNISSFICFISASNCDTDGELQKAGGIDTLCMLLCRWTCHHIPLHNPSTTAVSFPLWCGEHVCIHRMVLLLEINQTRYLLQKNSEAE